MKMDKEKAKELYKSVAKNTVKYDEEKHCIQLLQVMADPNKGVYSSYCVELGISKKKFFNWVKSHKIFAECYSLGMMYSMENWEAEGRALREEVIYPGTSNYKMDYWKTIGWYRFGIGKNGKIHLKLDPNGTPNEHYRQMIEQACDGEFTASEVKQLMEAINVGMNMHEKIALQAEIDKKNVDLATMQENQNVHNTFPDKSFTKKD